MFKQRKEISRTFVRILRTTAWSGAAALLSTVTPSAANAETYSLYAISTDPADWQVDRSPTSSFTLLNEYQNRFDVLKLSVGGEVPPSSSFRGWEGYSQRTTMPAGNSFIGGDIFIQGDWQSGSEIDYIRTGMWGAAMPEDAVAGGSYVDAKSVFPIIQFTNQDGAGRLEIWDTTVGDGFIDLPDTASLINYGGWNALSMRLIEDENKIEYFFNNHLIYTWVAPSAEDGSLPEQFWAMYLKARNNGVTSFDTYWSNLLAGLLLSDGEAIGNTSGDVVIPSESAVEVSDGATIGGSVAGQGTENAPAIVSFAGAANIGGSVIGQNSTFIFSKDAGAVTRIAGNVQLEGQSTTSGGTVDSPITVRGNVSVEEGSVLGGNWQIAGDVQSSGKLNPGNSIGIVSVAGDLTLTSDSIYDVEVDQAGNADLIAVGGTANLAGGVNVSAIDGYQINHQYTILTANDGFAGSSFDPGLVTWNEANFTFLTPHLTYDTNNVYMNIDRNGVAFSSVATTHNQAATAEVLDGLAFNNDLFTAVAALDGASARLAFDQLSGEVHASVTTGLLEDSRFVREATGRQLRGVSGNEASFWTQGYGSWGTVDGTAEVSGFDRNTGGIFIGADAPVFDNFRLGIVGGYGHSSLRLEDGKGSASIDSYSLGVYGGGEWNNLGLRLGVDNAWHSVSTNRSVGFTGFDDALKADYHARTTQAYGDIGYKFDVGSFDLEPFAGLAYVNVDAGHYGETGGSAALSGSGADADATFTTLGLRASSTFLLGDAIVTANGMLGWRHSFDEVNPTATHAFAASNAFTVSGTPLSRDVAVIEAGLSAALSANVSLGVTYSGQFGSGISEQGVRGNLNWKF
ncbi:autotransporter domain-containing protein [Shinella sp. PSBB067]|uniref:autotransporter outer membrane beta-barrel domain-containing protein n=1 Tax=Shinella sp. PSBB067 TaxID=2715959 RepID=UPI00193B2982|nr:autotransporter domain-containing protein [Shinella sp. PSBB067]QRI63768.1 autotransporter domain-containing protein [Shinella sp. PSBB067]